jgi:uncharacterized small protein (DUF1192 family)
MSLFKKNGKKAWKNQIEDTLPEFVDSLLDQADLDSIEETDPLADLHKTHYGIDQAIELMSKLPKDKTDLVVSVVKETLSSANVDMDEVIADAQHKAESMQQRIAQLDSEIAELKARIARKVTETAETQAALNETLSVKKLLQQSNDSLKLSFTKTNSTQPTQLPVVQDRSEEKDKTLNQSMIV